MSDTAIVGVLPKCDFCKAQKIDTDAIYDFRTRMGPWANGCATCWRLHRLSDRLGTGFGQKLVLDAELRAFIDGRSPGPAHASRVAVAEEIDRVVAAMSVAGRATLYKQASDTSHVCRHANLILSLGEDLHAIRCTDCGKRWCPVGEPATFDLWTTSDGVTHEIIGEEDDHRILVSRCRRRLSYLPPNIRAEQKKKLDCDACLDRRRVDAGG